MAQTLVHLTHGREQPDRVALAFQVALAAGREGHAVTLFLTGDAVRVLCGRDPERAGIKGTEELRAAYGDVVAKGAKVYVSSASAQDQRLTPAEMAGCRARFVRPAG
jgi:predicted peroxiredoxin